MRVALLSGGPSLTATWPQAVAARECFDLLIGVNGAATLYPVHWWSVGDWQTIYQHKMVPLAGEWGLPSIWTMTPTADRIEDHGRLPWMAGVRIKHWGQAKASANHPQGWSTWSATAALVLACELGAKSIDMFGVDMAGTGDCLVPVSAGHNERRWERERKVWLSTLDWLHRQNVAARHRQNLKESA